MFFIPSVSWKYFLYVWVILCDLLISLACVRLHLNDSESDREIGQQCAFSSLFSHFFSHFKIMTHASVTSCLEYYHNNSIKLELQLIWFILIFVTPRNSPVLLLLTSSSESRLARLAKIKYNKTKSVEIEHAMGFNKILKNKVLLRS